MEIKGLQNISNTELNTQLQNGAKFVLYQYCISILILTFRRTSDVYFIRSDESAFKNGIGYTLISLVMGWWGFPWGPIYTVGAIFTNLTGGKDVTDEVIAALVDNSPEKPVEEDRFG